MEHPIIISSNNKIIVKKPEPFVRIAGYQFMEVSYTYHPYSVSHTLNFRSYFDHDIVNITSDNEIYAFYTKRIDTKPLRDALRVLKNYSDLIK